MSDWGEFILAIVMLVGGIRLSAFFSGSETGFYRLSVPRLNIDARAGDRPAKQLLWFVNNPTYFVATCLIGNNVANYICTVAISSAMVVFFGTVSESLEVMATLIMAPVIFQFAELLPKSLLYLVPYSGLKRGIRWLRILYILFLPISWPLVQFSKLFEAWSFTGEQRPTIEILRGRNSLAQLMQQGRREGILTDLQSRVANGMLQLAPQPVTGSMIPGARVLGISDTSSRKELLDFARRFGVSAISLYRGKDETAWYGYVVVSELILNSSGPLPVHPMPVLPHLTSKLEALHHLQVTLASYGVVKKEGHVLGVVARNGLVEQIFRPELGSSAYNPI